MGKVAWYPTRWNTQQKREPSAILARRVQRRNRPEFKAQFQAKAQFQGTRAIAEAMHVYTLHSELWNNAGVLRCGSTCTRWSNGTRGATRPTRPPCRGLRMRAMLPVGPACPQLGLSTDNVCVKR